jgi:hypothetical protein
MVYTGSINRMFFDTLKILCDAVNRGWDIGGRPVRLEIFTHSEYPSLVGPNVRFPGYVSSDAVPGVLAGADIAVICVSFNEAVGQLVRTSLYTKTVDYLASGRPVLIVSPRYTAEVDYFGSVAEVVDRPDPAAIRGAVAKLVGGGPEVTDRVEKGLDLVRRRHSLEALEGIFLQHLRAPVSCNLE